MMQKPPSNCDQHRVQLALYLDQELDSDETRVIEAHLKECGVCREAFNEDRWFLECLRKAEPLYNVPAELRQHIEASVPAPRLSPPIPAKPRARGGWVALTSEVAWRVRSWRFAAAVMSVVFLAGLWGIAHLVNPTQSLTFASIAVDAHQRHILGNLPLELVSESPVAISNWFDGKVPFNLELPNYPEVSGEEKLYHLQGARLIGFNNDYAAYVAYQMGRHPISLVVTSSDNAKPQGGEEIRSKGLVIHYETRSDLKVITWSHRNLTYALVSDLEERGEQSCLVCHQTAPIGTLIGRAGSSNPLDQPAAKQH